MLGLVILIFLTIASGLFSVYLYNLEDISFILLYPYFFGTFIVFGIFLLNIVGLIVYIISLKNSTTSTDREKKISKILLWIISFTLLICVIIYFVNLSYIGSDEWKTEQYIKQYIN